MKQKISTIIISIISLIIVALIVILLVFFFSVPRQDAFVLDPTQTLQITDYINHFRAQNQAPPLVHDPNIANVSQKYAEKLLQENKDKSPVILKHSGNPAFGENLAFFQGFGNNKLQLLQEAVRLWYEEIKDYNFNQPGFSEQTGHFTALVWKSSSRFGIGIAIDPKTTRTFIVMNLAPPGNVMGRFRENVLPPVK